MQTASRHVNLRGAAAKAGQRPRRLGRHGAGRAGRAAFTLVELLVVVAILALLLAILSPGLRNARDAARTAVCQTHLRHLGTAFLAYAADSGGTICYDTQLTSWTLTGHGYGLPTTPGRLSAYLSDTPVHFDARTESPGRALCCPAYEMLIDAKAHAPFPGWQGKYPTSFESQGAIYIVRTYRQNDWLCEIPADHEWVKQGRPKPLARLSRLRNPAAFVLAGEGYSKSLFTNFESLYYNPRHWERAPAVRADGSIHMYTPDSSGGTGYLWAPDHGVNSSYPVDTWGSYLHPDYTRPY